MTASAAHVLQSAVADDAAMTATLEDMKASTRRLDAILQQLCARNAAESSVDARGHAARTINEAPVWQDNQPLDSAEAFISAIHRALAPHGVRVTEDALRRWNLVSDEPLKTSVDAAVAALTFLLPIQTENQTDDRTFETLNELSISQAEEQLLAVVEAVDHLAPSHVTRLLAKRMTEMLAVVSAGTLGKAVAEVLFPATSLPPTATAEWSEGSRVVKVGVEERGQQGQWGLRLECVVNSIVRVRVSTPQAQDVASTETVSIDSPRINTSTRVTLFVAKQLYATKLESTPDETSDALETRDSRRLPEVLRVFHVSGLGPTLTTSPSSSPTARAQALQRRRFRELSLTNVRLPRNRIVQAACARTHTLLLSDTGLVFSFGQATDGALGHGDVKLAAVDLESSMPRLIEWFITESVVVQSVACGGDDVVGAHSAAVSVDGHVFTWGGGVAFLLGAPLSRSLPGRVRFPTPVHSDPIDSPEQHQHVEHQEEIKIASIACGSGFSIAIATTGRAFAWGKWSDGRLGLGKIPAVTQMRRRHRERRQLQRFLLHPQELMLPGVTWRKISCGDAHAVGLSTRGELFTWGRGAQGQLGHGSLADAMTPVAILDDRRWIDVAAGSDFSLAVDSNGEAWSWGGCGGSVLGLSASEDCDRQAIVTDVLIQRHRRLRQQAAATDSAAVGFYTDVSKVEKTPSPSIEAPPFRWQRPQRITTLADNGSIRSVSAGVRHAAAISELGELFLWGTSTSLQEQQDVADYSREQVVVSPLPTLVTTPRVFVDSVAERVICGGDQVVVLTSESFLARAMHSLFTATASASVENYVDTAADLVLIVDGRALWAHKFLLARRSRVLRELILNEERAIERLGRSDVAPDAGVTELLLPGLRLDVARVVLEFLYSDNLTAPAALDPQSFLLRDVLRAAQRFAIPRLERLCHWSHRMKMIPEKEIEAPADSLADDLSFAFGDETWSDLTLVAEARKIAVHRCILIARSDYFRALLTFESRQADPRQQEQRRQRQHELVIEHSHRSLWRVLHFIYNDALVAPSSRPKNHKRIAADKFGLARMKRLCEHAIQVTLTNCLDVLQVADLVQAVHLKQVALQFLQRNLSVIASDDSSVWKRLSSECPHLLNELYERIREDNATCHTLRRWQRSLERVYKEQGLAREAQWQAQVSAARFPWIPLIAALIFATLYLTLMHAREYDYPFVPAVNVVVLGGAMAAALLGKL
ncbi:hypothetical protein PINS_up013928 [Pythium insidiosum]|nr:hypothetical protein PINS_up013928 [Pythium insidiosum]